MAYCRSTPVNSCAAPVFAGLNTYHHPDGSLAQPVDSCLGLNTYQHYIHLVEVEVDEVDIGQCCEQVFRWSLMVIGGCPPDDISVTLM